MELRARVWSSASSDHKTKKNTFRRKSRGKLEAIWFCIAGATTLGSIWIFMQMTDKHSLWASVMVTYRENSLYGYTGKLDGGMQMPDKQEAPHGGFQKLGSAEPAYTQREGSWSDWMRCHKSSLSSSSQPSSSPLQLPGRTKKHTKCMWRNLPEPRAWVVARVISSQTTALAELPLNA